MTPEQAYEALLRNGGKAMDYTEILGHRQLWFFDHDTGVLCSECECGCTEYFQHLVRPAPDEPDHDPAYDLPVHVDPGATE